MSSQSVESAGDYPLPDAGIGIRNRSMRKRGQRLLGLWLFVPLSVFGQIDPIPRDLVQIGYNQAFQGHSPLAGYAFYYHNQPDFLRTNLTLRLTVAPVYADSELGFINGLGPNTDFGLGLAGGGFADGYNEIHGGTFYPSQSFAGNGAELSASLYHRFNPAARIPLNYILRGGAHDSFYAKNNNTAPDFKLPPNHADFNLRTGLRWGGCGADPVPAAGDGAVRLVRGPSAQPSRTLRQPGGLHLGKAEPPVLDGSGAGLHAAR